MKRILLSLVFVVAAGFAAEAAAQTISGSIPAVKRGGSVRGTVSMSIPAGLHVNSNRPNNQYSIPTTVRVSADGARVSAVSYPRGKNRKFGFSDNAINVYEGRVNFTFNLTVPANFRGETVRVRVVVRYQACTDEVCYSPKTREITLTARVR